MLRFLILALLTAGTIANPAPQRNFFSSVFPAPDELGLFIAHADGTDEHPLLSPTHVDYDAPWSADGAWIAFTSDGSDVHNSPTNNGKMARRPGNRRGGSPR